MYQNMLISTVISNGSCHYCREENLSFVSLDQMAKTCLWKVSWLVMPYICPRPLTQTKRQTSHFYLLVFFCTIPVADPEGFSRTLLWDQIISFSWGIFYNTIGKISKNEPPFLILNSLFRNPGSAHVPLACHLTPTRLPNYTETSMDRNRLRSY